jgi:nucleoside-diphosphate-sugar epimerase
VVFASSSSVYGANRVLPKTEEDQPLPVSPEDVVEAFVVAAAAQDPAGEVINACAGTETSLLALLRILSDSSVRTQTHFSRRLVPAKSGQAMGIAQRLRLYFSGSLHGLFPTRSALRSGASPTQSRDEHGT